MVRTPWSRKGLGGLCALHALWAVDTARRVIAEFHRLARQTRPGLDLRGGRSPRAVLAGRRSRVETPIPAAEWA
jgi:hypothetical protein